MPQHRSRRFRTDRRGGVLITFAVALPLLLGAASAAVEYGLLVKRRHELQTAADQAAMTGTSQFLLANADETSVKNFAEVTAKQNARTPDDRTTTASASAVKTTTVVQVSIQESVPTLMGKLLSLPTADLQVKATARLSGSIRLCLLALDPAVKGAVHLEKKAQLTADDCSVYSNSKNAKGIEAGNSANVNSRSACTAGGYDGSKANFNPVPQTNCPPIQDPLATRAAPSVGDCISLSPNANTDPKSLLDILRVPRNEVNRSITLEPGTYCGGLKITKDASVTLNPGVYVMKDGPLIVDKKASMTGQNVGFYFTGDRGGLRFDKDTTISLTAPKDGVMAGLLMFEERAVSNPIIPPLDILEVLPAPLPPASPAKPLREYRIVSNNARTMLGTIYLPSGRLVIDAERPVADQSAYTVIVAQLVNLYEGPNLVLNARYSQTDVPVPKGVGPTSGSPVLTQ